MDFSPLSLSTEIVLRYNSTHVLSLFSIQENNRYSLYPIYVKFLYDINILLVKNCLIIQTH